MAQPAIATTAPPDTITYEEFLDLPDDDRLLEWVDGRVITVTVTREHDAVSEFLLKLMGEFADIQNLGDTFHEPFQMKTGPDLPGRSPDVMFVATANLARVTEKCIRGPADLVVEVVSPGTATQDRREKFREYREGGVREYWIVDPDRQQADFYLLGDDGKYHAAPVGADGVYHSAVLEGFWLRVEWLWQEPRPTLARVLREWGLV